MPTKKNSTSSLKYVEVGTFEVNLGEKITFDKLRGKGKHLSAALGTYL